MEILLEIVFRNLFSMGLVVWSFSVVFIFFNTICYACFEEGDSFIPQLSFSFSVGDFWI